MDWRNLRGTVKKYRYVLAVSLVGIALMLLPSSGEEPVQPEIRTEETPGMEARLEQILSRVHGAGEVAVMLTEAEGEQIIYQTDGEGADTVLITDAQRNEQGLIRTRRPPAYCGAIVVCEGADSAAVRLSLVEAVSRVTGLGADRITVLKME